MIKNRDTNRFKNSFYRIISLVGVCVVVFWVFPTTCIQPEKAERVLRQSGYKNINITGWRPFAKSENDIFSTGFEATSPNGESVSGAVTSGPFKGATIRLD